MRQAIAERRTDPAYVLQVAQLAVREDDGRWRWLHSEPIREWTCRTAALKAARERSATSVGYGPPHLLWVLATAVDALDGWLARVNGAGVGTGQG